MRHPARWLSCAVFLAAAQPASATIAYRVSVARPDQHSFHVMMTVEHVRSGMMVALPAWNGTYEIRDFAYRLEHFRADRRAGAAGPSDLVVSKVDKQTWRIAAPADVSGLENLSVVHIAYDVYWDEAGPFSSQLNAHHAFLNLADILLYLPDRRGEEVALVFDDLPSS